jgi:hypothetical protein
VDSKEEGRRKKEEGRRKREEGRGKKEEGRRKREKPGNLGLLSFSFTLPTGLNHTG